ncbi:30S ribosomal protein S13 [Candidatus Woesearchaeota archaeon]|nr:30S ribosomal protein S13 [Candidatus Woesearchaeota archaeon]MBW2978524.1 30S ribosomal protein S13 [Candidatus Woesearchaeota archaeon]
MTEEQKIRHLVRIANADIDGKKQILYALKKAKGVDIMFANAALKIAGINLTKKAGYLSDQEVKKIEEILKNPKKHGIPAWLYNRRKDMETGEDKHLLGADLQFTKETDIKTMKKIKTYRGVRHIRKLPVRGQKTRSNFRPNKGKVTGVKRSKVGKKAGK